MHLMDLPLILSSQTSCMNNRNFDFVWLVNKLNPVSLSTPMLLGSRDAHFPYHSKSNGNNTSLLRMLSGKRCFQNDLLSSLSNSLPRRNSALYLLRGWSRMAARHSAFAVGSTNLNITLSSAHASSVQKMVGK